MKPITLIARLSAAMHLALTCGVPHQVVCSILTISHRGRFARLFTAFASQFLDAHAEARKQPHNRQLALRVKRAKAVLDLIRVQQNALGKDKPKDKQILKWAQDADNVRIVQLRTA